MSESPSSPPVATTSEIPPPRQRPVENRAHDATEARVRILTTAAIVGLLLIPIRAKTVGYLTIETLVGWREHLVPAAMTACYDVLFVAGTAVFFLALLAPVVRRRLRPRTTARLHLAFSILTLVDGVTNIVVVPWLGQPFNFQWLYYSDFLRSSDAIASIFAAMPLWKMAALLAATAALVAGIVWAGGRASRALAGARRRQAVFCALTLATACYLGAAFRWRYAEGWDQDILANPVWAFAESCIRACRTPPLLVVDTPYGPASFVPREETPGDSILPAGHAVPKNVIVFVMESLAAEYVGLYGASHGVTPVLDGLRARSAVFTRAYAHAPATNLTLVALMTGRYPQVSFRPITASNPTIHVPHISRMLREQGFATGFFSSASLDFQRAHEFLAAGEGFDRIDDEEARPDAAARALRTWRDFVGTDDESTVDAMIAWAGGAGNRPFFGLMWTAQSHFPYYAPDNARALSTRSADFNRYLNAVAEGDRALGRLMAWLDSTGRADDTLVIVLGDHGQAFGQHNTFGHAGHTWEEHLHIPLVLVNAKLFSGEVRDEICGVADVVPTIVDLLRLPGLPGMQGRSLFRNDRPNTTYFFAAWSDFHVGYREGDLKVTYNMTKDTFRVFDLRADPGETRNLAGGLHDLTTDARLRLAGWMQWVDATYREAEAGPRAGR